MSGARVNEAGELDLTDLERLDMQSRDEWSRACAVALVATLGKQGCQLVAVRGLQEFIKQAREPFAGHEFKFEDFKRIFEIVRLAGQQPLTPEMILTRHRVKGRTR